MEVVTARLQRTMNEQSQDVSPTAEWLKATQNIGGLLVMDVGPRGGGKTTKASWLVQFYKEVEPNIRRITNVPIEDAYYVPDILRFLATKLKLEGKEKAYEIKKDGTVKILQRTSIPARMLTIVDESAISGLESRGSGLSALNSYLLALSRKLNVDCELISQMMSMVEKRGQWLSDFYWLCEPKFAFGNILDYFRYRIYNESYRKMNEYHLSRESAADALFPKFDSWDIPNYEALAEAYTIQYNITPEDEAFYNDIKAGKAHVPAPQPTSNEVDFVDKKWLRAPSGRWPGDTAIMGDKRLEILQRDWDFNEGKYRYRAREIPNNWAVPDAGMADEGAAA